MPKRRIMQVEYGVSHAFYQVYSFQDRDSIAEPRRVNAIHRLYAMLMMLYSLRVTTAFPRLPGRLASDRCEPGHGLSVLLTSCRSLHDGVP